MHDLQPERDFLFVYGTLMRGQRNDLTLHGAEFVTNARVAGVTLVRVHGASFPAMVRSTHIGSYVVGELWRVDDALLARLDAYEGAHLPNPLYARVTVAAYAPEFRAEAHAYLWQREVRAQDFIGASWRAYQQEVS